MAVAAASFEVLSPASGEVVGTCPSTGREETARAIEAAAEALPGWSGLAPVERAQVLVETAQRLTDRTEELARLIALEGGKPVAEARGEVGYAAGFLRFYAAEAEAALAPESHPDPEGKRVKASAVPPGCAG